MIVPPNPTDRCRGKRYIAMVRQSSAAEGTQSSEAQLNWMHAEGQKLGMTLADDIVLAGVTGSIPGKRTDIQELFERKTRRNDFEVLMIQRLDRMTRSGVAHGFWFEQECARHGIVLLYPGEDLPENEDHAAWAKMSKFQSAKDQAKSISQRSTQGWLLALRQGRCLPTSRTPYGCDRLYLSSEGEPLFRIRCLADGRQRKLDLDDDHVIETFGANSRFRKQKDQKPLIVPGEPMAADAVRLMFELHYSGGGGGGWGGKRIADRLNGMGLVSPTGKGWGQRQVESIYENPIYCGVALGGRTSQGIYNRRGRGFPEAIFVSAIDLASMTAAPRMLRPPDEWVWVEQAPMADFLPSELSALALPLIKEAHVERWKRSQDPGRPTRSTNKHKDSAYILTGLLVDDEFGEPLTGVLCGKVGKKVRKYRHRRGRLGYRKGSPFNNYFRAAELESATLGVILDLIATPAPGSAGTLGSPGSLDLRQRIVAAIAREASTGDDSDQLAALQKERDELAQKFQRIADTMLGEDQQDIAPVLKRLRLRRRELEAQIEKFSGQARLASTDPDALADLVLQKVRQLPSALDQLDTVAKRDLLRAFVEKVEVHMETRHAQVFLRLPPWAMKTTVAASGAGRLAHSSPSPTVDETHPYQSVRLALADCQYVHDRSAGSVCYRCRRRVA